MENANKKLKVISFLGKGPYQPAIYYWQNENKDVYVNEVETKYIPVAINKMFKPETIYLLLTYEAKKTHLDALQSELENFVVIDIPEGKTNDELWMIFDACKDNIKQGDKLIIDITHSFRYIPFIVFGAIEYLKQTKNVEINHILYGAFEASKLDMQTNKPKTPIFDLLFMSNLVDWIVAVKYYLESGNGSKLKTMLANIQNELYKSSSKDKRARDELPKRLKSIGDNLEKFCNFFIYSQPVLAMEWANRLDKELKETITVEQELKTWAKPLAVVLPELEQDITKLAYEKPEELSLENLDKQMNLIFEYKEKHLATQMVTLAREWIVSVIIYAIGEKRMWLEKNFREKVEKIINVLHSIQIEKNHDRDIKDEYENKLKNSILEKLPYLKEWLKIWDSITQERNKLAHCGMSRDAGNFSLTTAEKCVNDLKVLYEKSKSDLV